LHALRQRAAFSACWRYSDAFRGPATKEEKAEWDLWVERKKLFEEELEELEALSKDPKCRQTPIVLEELEKTKKVIEFIRRAVG
jgi:hypothetical protein